MPRILKSLALLFIGFSAVTARAADANVQAALGPESISLGESAVLRIVINGSRSGNPQLPQVDGLQFENPTQSSQFSWVNGTTSSSVTLTYRVVPTKEGSYTIPPIICQVDGKNIQTQPLSLKVLKDSSAGNVSGGNVGAAQAQATARATDGKNNAFFGQINGLPEKVYAGQVVPVTINFYINRNANLQVNQMGMPSLKNDAFTISSLKPNQIRQHDEIINGVSYFVISAPISLTALKEGAYELSAQWPITILVMENEDNRPANSNDPFDDPFFRGFFRRPTEKQLTINSTKSTVDVLPLPQEGRPASFAGAIGKFEAKINAAPAEIHAGDPVTLKTEIHGVGNFDRISAPSLSETKGWRVYPATGHFEPADNMGMQGVKTFSQALIPQDEQIKILPSVEFSYFDPQTAQYVTLHPTAPNVAILPAEQNKALAQQASVPTVTTEHEALAPIRLEEGVVHEDMKPVTAQTWFWAMQGGPLLLGLAGLFLLRRYRKQVLNLDYQTGKKIDRNIVQALQSLDMALANEDSAAFAEAASRALRERLAGLWHARAESITTADVRYRLGADGEPIVAIFEAADAVTYAGRRFSRDEMFDFKKRIMEQLKQMELKS